MSLNINETIKIPNMDSAFKIYETHWRKTSGPWQTERRQLPVFELNLLMEGEQDVNVGDTAYEMRAGDILLVKPGTIGQVVGTRNNPITYFVLHFDVEDYMLRTILSQYRCGLHPWDSALEREIRGPLEQLVLTIKMHQQQDMSHPAIRMKLMSHFFGLFAALGNIEDYEYGHGMNNTGLLIAYRLAEQIEQVVKGGGASLRSKEGIITRIAENLGYSTSYCYRVFHKAFGLSPQGYMSNVILHQARLELINAEQSLDQIAEKLGFQDGPHFSKQFKRWTGYSPREYRRNPMSLIPPE